MSAELHAALAEIVGPERVASGLSTRAPYGRDMWPRLLFAARQGQPPGHPPDAVVWPEHEHEVVAIVRRCRELKVPVVPYGAGSGVCGGAVPIRGGVTLDLKRLAAIEHLDDDALTVSAQAGINGQRLEDSLGAHGLTLGHFPSSIYCSTLGGWLAARSAGQMSTRYGKIEDMVTGLRVVTGRGELLELGQAGRATAGPDWMGLILGSEGTLGVITAARLRLRPAPAVRHLRGIGFAEVPEALAALRGLLQRGLRPAVVRLYDELDTLLHLVPERSETLPRPVPTDDEPDARPPIPSFEGPPRRGSGLPGALGGERGAELVRGLLGRALHHPRWLNRAASVLVPRLARKGCLLIVGVEGARPRADVEAELVFGELVRAGGKDLGEGPGKRWFAHRYNVSYNMSKIFEAGAFVDTMEVAATWDRLGDLYAEVRAALSRHAFVMAHFSHVYAEGCSIYFTFVGQGRDREDEERRYDTMWKEALAAATRAGGTISHHHGIGLAKGFAMRSEHGDAMAILEAAKQAFDPDGIMNPGKLGLAERRRTVRR
jgi:alkyldihydroxyacetonephosphate synthase